MRKPDPIAEKTARLRAARLARDAGRPKPVERSCPVVGMDDELGFGKHRGKLLRDVIEEIRRSEGER